MRRVQGWKEGTTTITPVLVASREVDEQRGEACQHGGRAMGSDEGVDSGRNPHRRVLGKHHRRKGNLMAVLPWP